MVLLLLLLLLSLLLLLYEETFKYRLSCFSINYALFPDASWRISLTNAVSPFSRHDNRFLF